MGIDRFVLRAKSLFESAIPRTTHARLWTRRLRRLAQKNPALKPLDIQFDGNEVLVSDATGQLLSIASYRRRSWYQNGIDTRIEHLVAQYRAVPGELKQGDILVDIGANIGEFSLYWARQGVQVVAIEADPLIFAKLQRNLSPFPNATCLHMAVWNTPTVLEFFSSVDTADSSIIQPEHFDKVVQVTANTLDNIIQEQGLTKVSLIKCDAEGAEPEVFQGAGNTLAITDRVLVDVGPERGGEDTLDDVFKLLSSAGFTIAPPKEGQRAVLRAERTPI